MAGFGGWLRRFLGEAEPAAAPPLPHARTPPQGPQSFAADNNEFSVMLYGQLRQRPGNLFFSPFSIRTALGMTHAGARGETAMQMQKVLCISSSDEAPDAALAETVRRLNAAGGGEYTMAVANSLWGQRGAPLQPAFLDLITQCYSGTMNLVDFHRGAEAARVMMNQWVEDTTRQKIRELIPPGGVDADTRLVLVNAVYFKGIWVQQFAKAATRDALFHLEGGGTVQAPMMHQQQDVRYVHSSGYQAVDLSYRGVDVSLLVLLPDRKDGLRNLEETLSASMLRDCVAHMDTHEVELFLPRFKISWGTVDARDQLTALGMPLAFERFRADFSGINGREPPHEDSLFISAVFHKAIVEMNEEGTEAAAATAVMMPQPGCRPAIPPRVPLFRADHPFLFAIRDRKSGAILFLGRMADPTQED